MAEFPHPGGTHPQVFQARRKFMEQAEKALATLVKLMEDSDSERIKLDAAVEILDRGIGKPAQAVIDVQDDEFIAALSVPQLEQLQVKLAAYITQQKSQPAVVTQ